LAIVDRADAIRAVCEVDSVHTVDADQENVLNSALTDVIMIVVMVLRDRGNCRTRSCEGEYGNYFFHCYLREQ
jgi:hypothetical protein